MVSPQTFSDLQSSPEVLNVSPNGGLLAKKIDKNSELDTDHPRKENHDKSVSHVGLRKEVYRGGAEPTCESLCEGFEKAGEHAGPRLNLIRLFPARSEARKEIPPSYRLFFHCPKGRGRRNRRG